MKMVYTHENYFIVSNIKNMLEAEGINTFINNEFSQGALGEVSATDTWLEIWIFDDANFDQSIDIIAASQSHLKGENWVCNHCSEDNTFAFELCWNCQHEQPQL